MTLNNVISLPDRAPGNGNNDAKDVAAERQLVRRASRGDQEAFRQIVEQNKLQLFQLALGVVPSRELAEDVVQESFIKAYRALPEFRSESRLSTWLHRITFLTAIDAVRAEKRRRTQDTTDNEPELLADNSAFATAESSLESAQTRQQIDNALGMLTPLEQSVFALRHTQNFKLRDIAEIVNRPEGTVKNALFSAIRKLRQQLLEAGEGLQEVERC